MIVLVGTALVVGAVIGFFAGISVGLGAGDRYGTVSTPHCEECGKVDPGRSYIDASAFESLNVDWPAYVCTECDPRRVALDLEDDHDYDDRAGGGLR